MDIEQRQFIYKMTKKVRELARRGDLQVDREVRKNPEWKNFLLPMISSKFIIRQLEYIQPFCCIYASKNLVEFEIPYYYRPRHEGFFEPLLKSLFKGLFKNPFCFVIGIGAAKPPRYFLLLLQVGYKRCAQLFAIR